MPWNPASQNSTRRRDARGETLDLYVLQQLDENDGHIGDRICRTYASRCWKTCRAFKTIVFFFFVIALTLLVRFATAPTQISDCPVLYGDAREQIIPTHPLPTLSRLWPDRQRGKVLPFPAVYAVREQARNSLGPIFWANVNDPGVQCILVVANASVGQSVFAQDGIIFDRHFEKPPHGEIPRGLKFAFGNDWERQRVLVMREVLTESAKHARATVAAPTASACILSQIRKSLNVSIDLSAVLRRCLALFVIKAVMGDHWLGVDDTAARLVECEMNNCGGRFVASTFECLGKVVRNEVVRRLGNSTSLNDHGTDSLLDSMVRLTSHVDGHPGKDQLSIEEVAMNTISFISAAWETTTLTMINTMWFLTAANLFPQAKDWQVRLRKESISSSNSDGAKRIILETLRWRPPVPGHGGKLLQDLVVGINGSHYKIPSGTCVYLDILATHGLPSVDRSSLAQHWNPHIHTSHAFEEHAGGLGGRHCPGGKMSRYGMEIILGSLLKEYEFTLEDLASAEEWLQGYVASIGHDLCKVIFETKLEVIPRSWEKQSF